jgi:hypothetical protein
MSGLWVDFKAISNAADFGVSTDLARRLEEMVEAWDKFIMEDAAWDWSSYAILAEELCWEVHKEFPDFDVSYRGVNDTNSGFGAYVDVIRCSPNVSKILA